LSTTHFHQTGCRSKSTSSISVTSPDGKGWSRDQISGHLTTRSALKDANIKEYEIGLDPVFSIQHPSNDRHIFFTFANRHIAKIEKEDV